MTRVKLSYTVEMEDVPEAGAQLLGLAGSDLQQAINLFNGVQEVLRGTARPEETIHLAKALEMIEEFRKALLNLDTRLDEVHSIIEGFEGYRKRPPDERPLLPSVDEIDDVPVDTSGADS